MFIFFVGVLLVTLIVTGGAFFISKQICFKEVLIMLGVQLVVAGISAAIVYNSATSDTEVWNSKVVSKEQDRVSCSHSYQCNCRSCNCDKKGHCSRCCSTCYEHSHDYDWNVNTSTREQITIGRVDRQGVREPKRWTDVLIGEPVATTHGFTNYVKASPDSLFRKSGQMDKYVGKIPPYPFNVYDYYRLNRLILVGGAKVDDVAGWRAGLDDLNASLGASKQVNVIIVIAYGVSPDYFYAVEQAWIGGKKNDVVVVLGVGDDGLVEWSNTMSWESNEIFKVKMRDDLVGLALDRRLVLDKVAENIKIHHKRKPMAEFEYLKSAITPSVTEWVVTMIVGLVISIGMSVFFHKNEVFPEYRNRFY
jgi:hypothetical protein